MSKKVIYIMSEYFAPFQNIGSIKFTKIAKYLSLNPDNQIFVFSRKNSRKIDEILEQDLLVMKEHDVSIFYIDEGFRYYREDNFFLRKIANGFDMLCRKFLGVGRHYYMSNQKAAKKFVKNGMKIITKNNLPKPDAIISTYDDWGGHYLAMEIKSIYRSAFWIADFRDPIGVHIKTGKYRKLCDEYSLQISEACDYVTVCSDGLFINLKLSEKTKKCIATNGFDYEDYEYVIKKYGKSKKDSSKLKFAYTGSFYSVSLTPLFNAIGELALGNFLDIKNIEIDYAGEYNDKVSEEIDRAGLKECYVYKGSLSRSDAIRLQDEADVLLTSVPNYKDWQGVLGGKVLGYLMLKKTIIGIIIGDTPNSELKKIIEKINCGWCYEEATNETDYPVLKATVFDLYKKKMLGQKISVKYNEDELAKFDLKNISKQYEKILEEI